MKHERVNRMKAKHIFAGFALLLIVACASIGAPDGGIFDEVPPAVVACYPADRSLGNNERKMRIRFNEYICK